MSNPWNAYSKAWSECRKHAARLNDLMFDAAGNPIAYPTPQEQESHLQWLMRANKVAEKLAEEANAVQNAIGEMICKIAEAKSEQPLPAAPGTDESEPTDT